MILYYHGGNDMTAKEVLKILGITRQTLTKYTKRAKNQGVLADDRK